MLVTKYSNFSVQPTLIIINISMPGVHLHVAIPASNHREYPHHYFPQVDNLCCGF